MGRNEQERGILGEDWDECGAWDGREFLAGRGQLWRGTAEGRIAVVAAGPILRMVLDFRFVIWF